MTDRERQMVFRNRVKTLVNFAVIESAMMVLVVTWLLAIW